MKASAGGGAKGPEVLVAAGAGAIGAAAVGSAGAGLGTAVGAVFVSGAVDCAAANAEYPLTPSSAVAVYSINRFIMILLFLLVV